jgi:hypothetical protein
MDGICLHNFIMEINCNEVVSGKNPKGKSLSGTRPAETLA